MKIICAAVAAASTVLLIIVAVSATLLTGSGISVVAPSPTALADIPPAYLAAYQAAATTCPGLPWTVLAGIGKVESDHGRSTLPGVRSGANSAGAQGPMQFLPATFARYGSPAPPGGTDPPTPFDPIDAIHAAARLLCDTGARNATDLRTAIWSYNHSGAYVHNVLATAARYTAPPLAGACRPTPVTLPSPASPAATQTGAAAATPKALAAIGFACAQLGRPYVWGGDGPTDGGFDCSGLTAAAYAAAGISLPRTAQTQHDAGPLLPADAVPIPGDLVFYGTPSRVHHVGLYLGHGLMINAPTYGQPVQVGPYRYHGDDYLGATRPAARETTRR